MNLDSLFTQFLRVKGHVAGFTEKTLTNFQESYKALERVAVESPEAKELSNGTMQEIVTLTRGKGMKPQTVNYYLSPFISLT